MTIYSKAPFKHVTEFTNLTTEELFATPEFVSAVLAAAGGGGLEGTNYIYVAANGTDVENAAELQAAYTKAQGMSPWYTNRITIIAAPGYYNFGSTPFIMNTNCIDLVSLDGNRSIIFNSSDPAGTIILDLVDSVYVKGVDVQTKAFGIETYYPGVTIENCKGGDYSFTSGFFNIGSKFIDCEGLNYSFGYGKNAYGTFINCVAQNYSFGQFASGTFTNCTAGAQSFGYLGSASGTFTECKGNYQSFGYGATTSGTFIRCIGQDECFGYNSNASGTFRECTGTSKCFGAFNTASGTFVNCDAGFSSYAGGGGIANGIYSNCLGEAYSWGGYGGGSITGKLFYCRYKVPVGGGVTLASTFVTVSSGGITRLCVDGYNAQNNQG